MASRTLTLALAADIDGLKKGLDDADKVVKKSSDQIIDFGKKAAAAFAVVGAAATAFAISAVKNAAADQAAQRKLEETIRASTNATVEQTKAVGNYINQTSIAIGVTDDELRPALSRLIRSTNDVQKAQDLLNLALDITAATGKPLEAVSNALGKAYDGNATSLGRLGLGLDANILKSKDFDVVYNSLTKTFGNFAENEALTTEKQFARIKIAVDEAKESIGAALLPVVDRLAKFTLDVLVPNLNALIAGLVGQNSVEAGITSATEGAYQFGEQLKSTIKFVISIKDELIVLGAVIASVFVVNKVIAFATAIMTLVTAMKALRTAAAGAAVASAFATGGVSVGAAAAALSAIGATYALSKFAAGGDAESPTGFGGGGFANLPSGGFAAGGVGGTVGGGFGDAGLGGATGRGSGGGGAETTYEKTLSGLKKTFDQLKKIGDDQKKVQAQLDIANNIIFANAMPDEDQLRAQRLAAITAEHLRRDDPSSFGNINITVNAIDGEGAARAVAKVLNDSAARSTPSLVGTTVGR
jgi:hypothetical protein